MNFKVFIDGAEGTTGLKIHEYFRQRNDIRVLEIDRDRRKDPEARLAMMKQADVSFLCLPDAAASEIAEAAPPDCRIIDTSTAHRTCKGWSYGFPELRQDNGCHLREMIRESNRVANPGCHATGVITLLRPLIQKGVLAPDAVVSAVSLTGYSGGGKKMIAAYEDPARQDGADQRTSPGQYGLSQKHKHIPEVMLMTGLQVKPSFIPIVADYFSGMEVTIPLQIDQLKLAAAPALPGVSAGDADPGSILKALYKSYYEGARMISVTDEDAEGGFIYANRLAGTNRLEISVHGDEESILLTATFDNLGKGASGAAVQNMNIMLGIEETKGLL